MKARRMLRYPIMWPMPWWYAAAVGYAAVLAAISSGAYWLVRGEPFWTSFAVAFPGPAALLVGGLWWADRRAAKRRPG